MTAFDAECGGTTARETEKEREYIESKNESLRAVYYDTASSRSYRR